MLIMQRVKGLCCPQLYCDECGGHIQKAKDGLYGWRILDKDGDFTAMFVCHRTCAVFERHDLAFEELAVLPLFIRNNLGITRKNEERSAMLLEVAGCAGFTRR